jgi:hypothetical protein
LHFSEISAKIIQSVFVVEKSGTRKKGRAWQQRFWTAAGEQTAANPAGQGVYFSFYSFD